jgi:hypothetical protein
VSTLHTDCISVPFHLVYVIPSRWVWGHLGILLLVVFSFWDSVEVVREHAWHLLVSARISSLSLVVTVLRKFIHRVYGVRILYYELTA